MAKRIVLDAKIDYPAACNAMVYHSLYSSTFIISFSPSLGDYLNLVEACFLLIDHLNSYCNLTSQLQETLLVHKDLVPTGGLNELIVNLRIEGLTSVKIKSSYILHIED